MTHVRSSKKKDVLLTALTLVPKRCGRGGMVGWLRWERAFWSGWHLTPDLKLEFVLKDP